MCQSVFYLFGQLPPPPHPPPPIVFFLVFTGKERASMRSEPSPKELRFKGEKMFSSINVDRTIKAVAKMCSQPFSRAVSRSTDAVMHGIVWFSLAALLLNCLTSLFSRKLHPQSRKTQPYHYPGQFFVRCQRS